MSETSILVGGSGGQGVLLLGRLIAYSGMLGNKEVTCFPSYGAEMRGGTANCTVIISDELIGSPIVTTPDILILMNEASFKRFQPKLKAGGLLLFDSSLIKTPDLRQDVCSLPVPASDIAASLPDEASPQGSPRTTAPQVRSANMVMLGALAAETGICSEENIMAALERLTASKNGKTLGLNREAIRRGIGYVADTKRKD